MMRADKIKRNGFVLTEIAASVLLAACGGGTPIDNSAVPVPMADGVVASEDALGVESMRWGDLRPSKLGQDELPGVLYDCFQEAVRWRLEDESSVVSFFSGGLDSRCVTASLLAEGVRVHTINVAPERSLDLILGRTAAERLGTRHYEYSSGRPDGVNSRVVAGYRAWLSGIGAAEFDRPPTAVWTGNGGSVAVGHVYLDDPMVTLMRQGRRPEAVRAYLRKNRIELTPRAFRPGMRSTVKSCCFDGVLEQVQRLDCHDEGRRLHLFLMLNDQRRHLTDHYEDIDLRRLELINPFFDARFLRLVMAEPVRPFLAHRFYNSWLKTFPFALDSMPWQAYADHVPCPLPMPSGLRTQWEGGYYAEDAVKAALNEVLQRSRLALASEHFPRTVLRAPALRMAWWLTRAGMGDYSYLLNIATAWTEYASRAGSGATKTKLEALSAHARGRPRIRPTSTSCKTRALLRGACPRRRTPATFLPSATALATSPTSG